MLVRGDSLTKGMSQYLVDQTNETKNIDVMLSSNIEAVNGEEGLQPSQSTIPRMEKILHFLFHLFSYLLVHNHVQIGYQV